MTENEKTIESLAYFERICRWAGLFIFGVGASIIWGWPSFLLMAGFVFTSMGWELDRKIEKLQNKP